jgi:ABC-type lipoprotein export system ATPase subunit
MGTLPADKIAEFIRTTYGGDSEAFKKDAVAFLDQLSKPASKRPKRSFADAPVIIETWNLEKMYKLGRKNKVRAIENVNLSVHQGEIVALTGSSGSGKSTLMHLIGGLDKPTGGDIIVDGQPLGKLHDSALSRYRNKTVGFVFQFFYLQPFLRVSRNVEVPLMFAKTRRKERPAKINGVVDAVGLNDRATYLPRELSGGQMQRVAIARALVNQPKILLADEPTGNLDSKNSESIMQLLQTIRNTFGTTMIIVTHDPRIAAWADREVRLEDGHIV